MLRPRAAALPRLALIAGLLASAAALPARADLAGPYLAARAASAANDYAAAVTYYDRLLLNAPEDLDAQEGALMTHVALGDFDRAAALADVMIGAKDPSQIAVLVALAQDAKSGDFAKGVALLDGGADGGQLVSGLYRAWALVGQGQMAEATKAFDALAKEKGLIGFASYHKALALAMVGDYEGADEIFSGKLADLLHGTRRGVLAHVQILSQLERDPDAVKLLDSAFGSGLDPELKALREGLVAGETLPFTVIGSATDGVAEIFYAVGQALNSDAPSPFALLHARLATWLRPDHVEAVLLTAAILETEQQYDLAIDAYAQVKPESPAFHAAELGRAEAMVAAGRSDAAIEVLEKLSRTHPDLPGVWTSLGDNLRREERFKEAAEAYDKAIALMGEPKPADWFVYYARGIAEERSDQWAKAEPDFREALKLSPDQPSVLNYLGYSYVEKKQNLDEALGMIERAVAARPDAGYILDSLGWAFYRLGRYDEAVAQMEKAVELEPAEPLLNDHLGDVYWAVGRKREAEFQWRRALNLGPGEAGELDLDRVRHKLEFGLDQVLKDEGAPPLHPAQADAAE
ncbi:MAG: tetratricopeptide repeat protein [Paenirhodobacter sp.]|uniref:tetratricopeptide repeat protein n=1 Tax=Paenirhodobacter sp. TaxID=1965326 RepID=UPI003D11BB5A